MAPQTRRSSAFLRTEIPDSDESSLSPAPAKDILSKRRGQSRKVTVASSSSASSAPTPTTNSSGSEYSTPLTSYVTTPAASVPAGGSSGGSAGGSVEASAPKHGNRIEVHLPPSKPAPDTHRALQQSIYSMSSKRKRAEVNDSEDDYDSDTSPDAKLARRLQDEDDSHGNIPTHRARHPAAPVPPRRSTQNIRAKTTKALIDSESEGEELATTHQSSKYPFAPKAEGKRPELPSNKLIRFGASDDEVDDGEEDDGMDKKNSDSDVPLARTVKRLRRSTRSAAKTNASPISRQTSEAQDEDLIPPQAGDASDTPLSSVEFSLSDSDSEEAGSDENSDSDNEENSNATARQNALVAARSRSRAVPSTRRKPRRTKAKLLEDHHPELRTMWTNLKNMPVLKAGRAEQPKNISRQLKSFQLEGLAWMKEMERMEWKGGILGDEMGLGKTIQAVSLIMSDWPAKQPSLVLVPPVAMMQWTAEISSYTDGTLKTLFFHGTNSKSKNLTAKDLKKYDVVIMSYNSLEAMFRKQEKGFKRKDGLYKERSIMHQTHFHRVILDEAHSIKTRTTMTAKACFALKVTHRWCLSGTPLQNRIGEFFSLVRFLNIKPFACYFCKQCSCSSLEWSMNDSNRCTKCDHGGMSHISLFNRELLNPIQKFGNIGPGAEALQKLRILTDRIMLRRLKKDHTNSMELPVKEIYVDRQFFGEEEVDFANSIMTSGQRNFNTYVAQGVLLNNYANIFGLIMQMRQVADHPDLILRKHSAGGQNILGCCICDEPAEEAIRSRCKHDFCRSCARSYLLSSDQPDCPRCHIPLSIDLEQPEIEQDEVLVKKSSIINRINMENWTSSSKIELLVHELHKLRSDNTSHKSIIFSQFTTMLQLIEWRLRRAGITTVMLDGSMTPAQRQASIDHFMKNVEVECFLVSLKAGGVALNLTEASRVFIVDPWWNPAAEWQSADRCHRIGQTRPCIITRLCIEDSVESRMVLLQEKKTNMINSTINSDDAAMESLTPADLQFLFRGN